MKNLPPLVTPDFGPCLRHMTRGPCSMHPGHVNLARGLDCSRTLVDFTAHSSPSEFHIVIYNIVKFSVRGVEPLDRRIHNIMHTVYFRKVYNKIVGYDSKYSPLNMVTKRDLNLQATDRIN